MVAGSGEGLLALVDSDTGRVVRRLSGHRGLVYTPGISADRRLLVTGSDDNAVRFGRSRMGSYSAPRCVSAANSSIPS